MKNWPKYSFPDTPISEDMEEIRRHNTNDVHIPGSGHLILGAADVWRDGVHLWRSYEPAGGDVIAWTDLKYPDLKMNSGWDTGFWGVHGVENIIHYPIPLENQLQPIGTARQMRDLLVTLLAIGMWPHDPAPAQEIPPVGTLTQRIWRSDDDVTNMTFKRANVSVRLTVAKKPIELVEYNVRYRAELGRRLVKHGAYSHVEMDEVTSEFMAPEGADVPTLARLAKKATGITGQAAQRRADTPEGSYVWHVSCAPYILTVTPITD